MKNLLEEDVEIVLLLEKEEEEEEEGIRDAPWESEIKPPLKNTRIFSGIEGEKNKNDFRFGTKLLLKKKINKQSRRKMTLEEKLGEKSKGAFRFGAELLLQKQIK